NETVNGSSISPDGAGGTTETTITPVINYVVHSGEWFAVAKYLDQITGGPQVDTSKLPGVTDTALVDWSVGYNGATNLVIDSTVSTPTVIWILSQPGIAPVNTLLPPDGTTPAVNALAAGLQSLTSGEDVRKAGEQLAPQTNYATQQVAITLAFLT